MVRMLLELARLWYQACGYRGARSPKTYNAYKADWRHFAGGCKRHFMSLPPASAP